MKDIKEELKKYASETRKAANERFFKTGKGQYGEGDIFIGVRVPDIRRVAKKFLDSPVNDMDGVISSEIHEERLLAILILVEKFSKCDEKEKFKIYEYYLKNRKYVNNWDLVDLSAHYIVGKHIIHNPDKKKILYKLVDSKVLWDRRIAIIATWAFIRNNQFSDTLKLARKLLGDKEDLMHKATGWMLREIWKKDNAICEEFLSANYSELPRTTLRYAIEKMDEEKRKSVLKGHFSL